MGVNRCGELYEFACWWSVGDKAVFLWGWVVGSLRKE